MSDYFLVPALADDGLRGEVNLKFPKRDKGSDGWIGDPSHAARKSEHNPCWTCRGRMYGGVRAIDIDIDDNDPGRDLRVEVLNATVGDPRVYYVISNGIIYSRTYGWAARRYTGENGHFHHVHVSTVEDEALNFDTSPWFDAPFKVVPKPVSLSALRRQFLIGAGVRPGELVVTNHVGRIQKVLVRRWEADIEVDGIAGPKTIEAWARWERKHVGRGSARIPDHKSLARFARGKFQLVA